MSEGLSSMRAAEAEATAGAAFVASGAADIARPAGAARPPHSYADALRHWRRAEDLSAWAAQRFRFDAERALQFSSTQRRVGPPPAITEPEDFFAEPTGICLDLARFAVETLRRVDPAAEARFLMVEFEPVLVDGHELRLHWIAVFRRDARLFFFADSDRPAHLAGPYAGAQDFIADYQVFRGRPVLRHLELDSLRRPQPGAAAR
jgi:hypothetical protein